jgi:hypothetical protein
LPFDIESCRQRTIVAVQGNWLEITFISPLRLVVCNRSFFSVTPEGVAEGSQVLEPCHYTDLCTRDALSSSRSDGMSLAVGFNPLVSTQTFNAPSPRLCRPMCGRGFALPETAPIFLWGCAPPLWRCGKSSNRVADPSLCLIPKHRGVAQKQTCIPYGRAKPLPHIGRQSRESILPNLCRYQWVLTHGVGIVPASPSDV